MSSLLWYGSCNFMKTFINKEIPLMTFQLFNSSLYNHQCVVPMIQKMLPVRCKGKSSLKHLLRYKENNWRSEILFLECLFINI